MIHKIKPLQKLFSVLQRIPHIAPRSLNKIAHYFIQLDNDHKELFVQALLGVETNLGACQSCHMLMQRSDSCPFCSDKDRNTRIICVVEQWYDVLSIEKTEGYTGLYHVLGGVISPLEGISSEDISIKTLCKRVKQMSEVEVFLALPQTPEGEVTGTYIEKNVRVLGARVSSIARGIPVGATLDSMDRLTIYKALSERRLL